jgi:hypothetical protein
MLQTSRSPCTARTAAIGLALNSSSFLDRFSFVTGECPSYIAVSMWRFYLPRTHDAAMGAHKIQTAYAVYTLRNARGIARRRPIATSSMILAIF